MPRELITADGEDLALPYKGNEELFAAFDGWVHSGACVHPDMEYASARVSNWSGYRMFREALARAGWEHFPVLRAELPQGNGGELEPEAARAVLEELRYFREEARLGSETVLVDDTGEVVVTYVAAYEGVFFWDGTYGRQVGADPRGLFVRGSGTELFRARRCLHEPLGPSGRGVLLRLTDLDTGEAVELELGQPVAGQDRPVRLEVEERPVTAGRYDYILRPLTEVCEASVAIGNPVEWC